MLYYPKQPTLYDIYYDGTGFVKKNIYYTLLSDMIELHIEKKNTLG